MDQDETWHASSGRPRPHCVRRRPSSLKKGAQPNNLRPMSVVAKRLDGSRCHLVVGTELGLNPGDIVLDGDPAPPSPKRGHISSRFLANVLWLNGWMDQDETWHKCQPQHQPQCIRSEPSSSPQKGAQFPNFWPRCLLWPNIWMDQDATWYGGRPRPA